MMKSRETARRKRRRNREIGFCGGAVWAFQGGPHKQSRNVCAKGKIVPRQTQKRHGGVRKMLWSMDHGRLSRKRQEPTRAGMRDSNQSSSQDNDGVFSEGYDHLRGLFYDHKLV